MATQMIVRIDPDDNKFIECAVALNAKFIISKALREVEDYMGIKIYSPKQFLDEYSAI